MKRHIRVLTLMMAALLLLSCAARAAAPDALLACPNADPARAEAYAAYWGKHPTFSAQQAVTLVNIGLNRAFYTNIANVTDTDDLLLLVNKYHRLASNYVPPDLTRLRYGSGATMRSDAAAAFDKMAAAAKAAGVTIIGVSGYRSYGLQQSLYSRYSAKDGVAAADRYSARPGHSEHQTGLAIDVSNGGVYTKFGGTAAHTWAVQHLHEYGFIIRYTKANEWITGYKDEAWHFRYVGVDAATEIYHLGITLEEYLDRYVTPTGSSTASGESVAGAQGVLTGQAGGQPGCPYEAVVTFSNVLIPVAGTVQWRINGVPVGAERPFTLKNGGKTTVCYVPGTAGSYEVSLTFVGPKDITRTWSDVTSVLAAGAFGTGLEEPEPLAPLTRPISWRSPDFPL